MRKENNKKSTFAWKEAITKRILILIIAILAILGGGLYLWFSRGGLTKLDLIHIKSKKVDNEHWITVFVHGNFNTVLGFLSASNVIKDDLKESTYKKIVKNTRKDSFFYQDQPILRKGLVSVRPSFDHLKIGNKFAVYPIMSAYKKVLETVYPGKEENLFYTFGWSGLMSKTERMIWSLRFYNALCEEVEKLRSINIKPKIRILSHSHGGNVSMNLALINDAFNNLSYEDANKDQSYTESKEYLEKTKEYISTLPNKEIAKTLKKQKKFVYRPIRDLEVDELILFGTPIQEENKHCLFSKTFKNVLNIYSEQDVVQGMDFVSSNQRNSIQRLEAIPLSNNHFKQIKIMIDKDLALATNTTGCNTTSRSTTGCSEVKKSFWDKTWFRQFFKTDSKDPTHKDFWFLAWNSDYTQPNFPLNPLPLVVITPLIDQSLTDLSVKGINLYQDIDLNIKFAEKTVEVDVLEHNKVEVVQKVDMSMDIINELKEKIKPWRPSNLTRNNLFLKMRAKI